MTPRSYAIVTLLLAGCSSTTTSVVVSIDAPGLTISQLTVDVALDGGTVRRRDFAVTGGRVELPGRLVLLLPDVAAEVTVAAHASDSFGSAWEASATTNAVPHHQTSLALHLGGGVTGGEDMADPADLAGGDLAGADLPPGADLPGSVDTPSLSLLAGQLGGRGEVDGDGDAARFDSPWGLALVGTTLYVVDEGQSRIRRVDPNGHVSTLTLVDSVTGQPASLYYPTGIAHADGYLYIAEWGACDLRKIRLSDGATSLFMGLGGQCATVDGDAATARVDHPFGLTFDGNGNLWLAQSDARVLRLVTMGATPMMTTPVGVLGQNAHQDGAGNSGTTAGAARLEGPTLMTWLADGLYVTDATSVRKVSITSTPMQVTTVLQPGSNGFFAGIVGAPSGALLVFDNWATVRRIVPGSPPMIAVVAGGTPGVMQDGPGATARLQGPVGAVSDGTYAWFVDDSALRKIKLGGDWRVTTVAGLAPRSGDSLVAPTLLRAPAGIAVDGDIAYFAEYTGNRVRKIDLTTGAVTRFVGADDSTNGHVDAKGNLARLFGPTGLALDDQHNLFISEYDGQCIRRVTPDGTVSTVAGNFNTAGAPPLFNNPNGMDFDGDHTLYISDAGNHRIRTLDTATFALGPSLGTGVAGDADATGATSTFDSPHGIAIDRARHLLYAANFGAHTIRQVDLAAADHPVTHLAGGAYDFGFVEGNGDGARFCLPLGLGFDAAARRLFVADSCNHTVRSIDLETRVVSTYAGSRLERTRTGPLPADIHQPWGAAMSAKGLLISSHAENALLLAR
ncbi:MAG: hypothetical protein JWN44_6924 [Myxococcales bacterium]|nr:hypothetical protein [Myxococcales bacterium]